MKRSATFLMLAALGALSLLSTIPASVQEQSFKTTFVPLGNGQPGVLYEPASPGPKAQVAVFAMHSAVDYLTRFSCTELSKHDQHQLLRRP